MKTFLACAIITLLATPGYSAPKCDGYWTNYFKTDNLSMSINDKETLAILRRVYPGICENPSNIYVRYLEGNDRKVEHWNGKLESNLLSKLRKKQNKPKFNEYEVRFCCQYPEPQCPTSYGSWTQWFDRDNPSWTGDYETLSSLRRENPGKICQRPIGIEAQLWSGLPYKSAGENVTINTHEGFYCKNKYQKDKTCEDYKVRFCCEKEPACPSQTHEWTQWFDRDNPSVTGDYETLTDLRKENPGKICQRPSNVHAQLVTGEPYQFAGESVTINTREGFYCKRKNQNDNECHDYKVRFCCEIESQCPTSNASWTQWFDRDNPSWTGDYETLTNLRKEYPGKICQRPISVHAQHVSGLPYKFAGENVTINTHEGFYCKNKYQKDKTCEDYKVRFCCEKEPACPSQTHEWTQWFDRDNPSVTGDYETLTDLRKENPGKICQRPTNVHAELVSGEPYQFAGENVTINTHEGFYCKRKNQNDNECRDYKVRFCCETDSQCPTSYASWTQWFDRDNPSATGDYETLPRLWRENPGKICQRPIGVEAQLLSGLPYKSAGEKVTISRHEGFYCKNKYQKDRTCEDYKVRFCCEKEPECPFLTHKWTQWFDRDYPSGTGDYETLKELRKEYPGEICERPTNIHAQLVSGEPYQFAGEKVTINVHVGFSCRIKEQKDDSCHDYRVRFCCPKERHAGCTFMDTRIC